jgi:hypothetical protein
MAGRKPAFMGTSSIQTIQNRNFVKWKGKKGARSPFIFFNEINGLSGYTFGGVLGRSMSGDRSQAVMASDTSRLP